MVEAGSQNYRRMFLRKYLNQIWLNLHVDHCHFGCKIAKKNLSWYFVFHLL
jgi:hypothetical protein